MHEYCMHALRFPGHVQAKISRTDTIRFPMLARPFSKVEDSFQLTISLSTYITIL